MGESSSSSTTKVVTVPVEIVSEEEMAFIEAALSSTCSILSSSMSISKAMSLPSSSSSAAFPSLLSSSRKMFSTFPPHTMPMMAAAVRDIEDSGNRSLLQQFRSRRGITVTDITATEWCDKQTELGLRHGKLKTEAMIAGCNRHSELEKQVVEKIEMQVNSLEEYWALNFLNFICGANQLLFEGLTRELPVIGVIEGTWIVGVIDEVRMPIDKATMPILVDTKTRSTSRFPTEAQKRNGRLQLMCYKYLYDNLVVATFPSDHFFNHFKLDPLYALSDDIKQYTASLGLHAKAFEDVVKYFRENCCFLPSSSDQLLLRYELQSDHSLLEECQFAYDAGWLKKQVQESLKFWSGDREAKYVSGDEKWKCSFCKFTTVCPMYAEANKKPQDDSAHQP